MVGGYFSGRALEKAREDKRFTTALWLLSKLAVGGYEAYLVGGCVRDMLRMEVPHDYDIATSALPEQVKKTFIGYDIIETGIKHGTVTVMADGVGYEITTFRIDCGSSDGRHPDKVKFTKSLKEDLARRDFTINAIAYNPEKDFVDPYDGFSDIRNGIIRCVGVPVVRFREDYLRILRAMRFSCTLGYKITRETAYGMRVCRKGLRDVSAERIKSELDKMVVCDTFCETMLDFPDIIGTISPGIGQLVGCTALGTSNDDDLYTTIANAMFYASHTRDIVVSYATLFRNICSNMSEYDFKYDDFWRPIEKELHLLKFDNATSKSIVNVVRESFYPLPNNEYLVRKLISRVGKGDAKRLKEFAIANKDVPAKNFFNSEKRRAEFTNALYKVLDEDCFNIKDLDVNGDEMFEIGYVGINIKYILNYLLDMYFAGDIKNEHDALIAEAKRYWFSKKRLTNNIVRTVQLFRVDTQSSTFDRYFGNEPYDSVRNGWLPYVQSVYENPTGSAHVTTIDINSIGICTTDLDGNLSKYGFKKVKENRKEIVWWNVNNEQEI